MSLSEIMYDHALPSREQMGLLARAVAELEVSVERAKNEAESWKCRARAAEMKEAENRLREKQDYANGQRREARLQAQIAALEAEIEVLRGGQ